MKHQKLISLAIATVLAVGVGLDTAQAAKKGKMHGMQKSATDIMERLDTDSDAVISLSEFLAPKLDRAERKFSYIDTDEDGLISMEDISTAREGRDKSEQRYAMLQCMADNLGLELPDRSTPEEHFNQVDTNSDGLLDFGEFSAQKISRVTERFAKIDANEDGVIDADELALVINNHQNMREMRQDCREQIELMTDLIDG